MERIQLTASKSLQQGKILLGVCEHREIWDVISRRESLFVVKRLTKPMMTKISGEML